MKKILLRSFFAIVFVIVNLFLTNNAFAAITQRGTSTTGTTTNTNVTISKPTGVVTGDVMIVNIAKVGNNTTAPSLSGWTLINGVSLGGGTARYGAVLYKVAGASEPTSYTFALGTGTTSAVGSIVAFYGVDVSGATPFDVTPGTILVSSASSTAVGATTITTATTYAAVIMFGMAASTAPTWSGWTTTSPGALTELYDNNVGTTASVGAAWAIKAASGATGAGAATLSSAERNGGILIALKPKQTITTGTISGSPFCAGAAVSVPFTITGTFTSGNIFTAQLSDASGGFTSPVAIGSLTQTTAGTISGTIPSGTLTGTAYRIRVVSSNPVITGTDNGSNLTVNPLPTVTYTLTATPSTIYNGSSSTLSLSGSQTGVNYQLRIVTTPVGSAVAGTGSAISFAPVSPGSTTTYNVLATNATTGCSVQQTSTATVTVLSTCITTHPSNVTICSGAGTSFSVVASGSPSYQWQVSTNNGGSWANITAAGAEPGYAGWTTSTLTLTGTIPSNNAYQYRCVLSGGCGQTSNAATLTLQIINISYTLSASPGLVSVSGSSTLTLSGSQTNVNYQLRTGTTPIGSPVAGTGSSISFAAVNPTTSTQYNVLATTTSGGCSAQITDTRTVIVNETGIIIDLATCNGQPGLNFFTNSDFGTTSTNNYQTPDQALFPGVVLGYPLGAYTNYIYGLIGNAIPDSNYIIANSTAGMYRTPQQVMGTDVWLYTEDRSSTPGIGDMYIVNASYTPGVFYTEVLTNLCENTRYEFRSEMINLYAANWVPNGSDYLNYFPKDGQGNYYSILPNVDFMLDGRVALNTGNIMNDGSWKTYGFTFRTDTGQTSLTLTMRNNSTGGIGNDIALDNILMRACGPEIDITINTTLPVCPGLPVTMTANLIASDYLTPEYQWQKSTDNGVTWNDISGANDSTYTSTNPAYGDEFRFLVAETTASLDNPNCSVASNPVSITTTAGITGTTPGSVCGTGTVTLGATANSGSTINWYANLTGGSSLGTGTSYTTPTISSTTTYYVEATNAGCTSNPRTSVVATVNTSVTASVSISASTGNSICSGTNVTFTATPTNGGATPSYQWKLNGGNVGTNSPTYSNNTLANGNTISCVMTSSISSCITGSPATSNTITMVVGTSVPASVSISANPGNTICQGTSVTFTAVATNGGATPNYQWKNNGSNIYGEVSNVYTTTSLVQGDIITCVMTTSLACATGSPATSNSITMTVNSVPTTATISTTPLNYCGVLVSGALGGNTPVVGTGAWSQVSGPGTTTFSDSTSGSSTATATAYGTYVYRWTISNETCTPSTADVTVNYYATPTATISGTTTVCQNATSPNITFTNPQNLPVTITYDINGANQTTINVDASDSATVAAPTTTAGAFAYNLVSVVYQSAPACSNTISGTATVTVTPTVGTPTAITISEGTEPTCQLTDGTTTTTYATTATNNTGFNWSLSNGSAGSLDPTTGVMTWANGFSGSVDIQVTANGCNGPSAQVIRTVTITTLPIATFSYTGTPYCQNAANPSPTFSGGGVAGTFSSTAGLVFVSDVTGEVNLSASTAGIYTVTNTIAASGGCVEVIASSTITITTLPTATIYYAGSPFYMSELPQSVTLTGTAGGTYTASPAGLSINALTGTITSASTAGIYTVTYTIAALGGCGEVTATTSVTVLTGDIIAVSGSTGADGYYASLTKASGAFAAINAQNQSGNTIIITIAKSSNTETGANSLNAGDWTTLTLYPTATGITISGTFAGPLINLNGADNVTIDGRVNATGAVKDLTITNTNAGTSASTIRFINSAENNTVQDCTIKGAETSTTKGIIFFSTATAGNGNDGNTIDNNDIISDAAGRPINAIYSAGSTGFENSGNTISNNNIYDVWRTASNSYGIQLAGFTTDWTISGNSFYETTTFIPTGARTYNAIRVVNTSGNNFIVSGNYIGGQAAQCGGSPLTVSAGVAHLFRGIYLNVGDTTASSVQNNTIKNFNYTSTSTNPWQGINIIAGSVNIGTATGNIIGSATGIESVLITGSATGTNVYGINIASEGTVDCQNNTIGSITAANDTANFASNIYGINKTGAGIITISNNTVGSITTASSINASSASTANAQSVIGISSAGTGTLTINNNTISNLTNSTNNPTAATAGIINGIKSTSGTNTISNNTIRDLSIANANTSATNTASACGIALTGATLKTVSGNTIYNLSNTYDAFAGNVVGLYFTGSTGANVVSGNFIHSLSVTGASSVAAKVYGIKIAAGVTTYYNNIINLGGNTATNIYGIYETGVANNNNNLYFNTVYIGGSLSSGATNKSYALYSNSSANTRNFRNNIFENARSTTDGASLHYAAYFNYAVITRLTFDYNDYYAPGTGGVLGYYNAANVTTLPLITGFDANSLAIDPVFANAGGTTATDYIPSSGNLAGTKISTIPTDYLLNNRANTPTMGAFEGTLVLYVDVYKSGVFQSAYPRLKDAFDRINDGTHIDALELRINANITETTSAVLYQSGYTGAGGTSNYTSVNIYPTVTGITETGNLAAPLIDINGAGNVTIDGRVNATGSVKDMIITNTNTSATAGTSTIRFINSAENNNVKYCTIKGSETSATMGVIFFSTATAGNGNDGNTIDNNNITSDAAGRPINAIYSAGSAGFENSGNTISNNNIYDFLKNGTASNGINLAGYNITWTITGNSLYETASFVPTASVAYTAINASAITSTDLTVSGNFIGGNAPSAGGTAWTKTNAFSNVFTAINLNVGTGTASNVQNNTIQNMAWSNSGNATWTGINIAAGNVNVGTVTGNAIGAATGAGSITVTGSATAANVYGINIASAGTVDCQNNTIGSITAANDTAAFASNIYGINKTAVAGTTTISNNTIGSTTTANSIQASSASTGNAQSVFGIYSTGTDTITINNNTIANLKNSTTNATAGTAGRINGIVSTNGTNTISHNTIHDLTIANANNKATNTASVCGIALTGATLKTVSGNTIYNLSNTYASFAGNVVGLYFTGSTGANVVSDNFIHSLTVEGATSTTASVYGIKIASSVATYSNNIISLGGNTKTTIYGISEAGAEDHNNNLYFNTVYIGGSLGSGTNKSYSLYSIVTANTRNFRNNILVNARSTTGGTSLHYAAYFNNAASPNLILGYNDYYAPGTGGVLGYYNGANVITLPLIAGQDTNSLNTDPSFFNAGSTVATDYKVNIHLTGITISGITTDFGGAPRGEPPCMGAWEKILRKWKGSISTDFANDTNWTDGTVPLAGENILFDNDPDRDCYLDGDRIIGNLIINQPVDKMVLNGYRLSVNGSLLLTNGGQIDAGSSNSTIAFTGSIAQSISSGAFTDNSVYNFTLNNSSGVSLNGDLDINWVLDLSNGALTLGTGTLTIAGNSPARTSGTIDAGNAGATLAFTNSSAITLPASIFTGAVNNMTIDGTGGVTASGDFSVNGILYLQSANPSSLKGSLDMGSSSILTMGSSATTIGAGDVTGIVKRTTLVAATSYTFGNQYTTIDFQAGGTLPDDISVKITIGSAPSWKTDAILRIYDIVRTGECDNTVILNLHYLDSELNANPEADLFLWDYQAGIPEIDAHEKTNGSTIDKWIGISNLNISYFPTVFDDHIWTLSKEIYVVFEGSRGWRMISSPTATSYGDLLSGFITQGATGSTYPLNQPNCLWFDETDTLTTNMSWRTMGNLTNSITPGRGQFFFVFDSVSGAYNDTLPRKMSTGGNANYTSGTFSFGGGNQPVTFSPRAGGQINTGPGDTIFYDTNISDEGWNLLGNPTYSTLNWDAPTGWTKINLDNNIYIWDPGANSGNGEYKVWNGHNGSLDNGLIAPYQAFWVHASAAVPGLSFTNSVLTSGGTFHGGGSSVKSQQAGPNPSAINLSLNAGGLQSTAIISFMADAKVGPDTWDAYRLEPPSDSWLELFTLSSPSHTMPLVINNLPVDKPDFLDLPLFVGGQQHSQSLDGNYTLHWELPPDWPADWAISLHDNQREKAISMSHNQNYDFEFYSTKSSAATTDSISVPTLPVSIINPVSQKSTLKSTNQLPPFSIIIQKGTYVDNPAYMAPQAKLLQNYPNPFSNSTTLRFSLPLAANVTLEIFDLCGQKLEVVVANRYFEAGIHNMIWYSCGKKSGIYFVRMKTKETNEVIKLIIQT
ncbi:MAG: T9SS type A sorting domain-containing protein [Bacteroidales bacterium]|nr:T9SS type A sorting domain-containing protein [Bacteroidales bacterium]